MAGGKETPRQKMIGMMYLVLTALLALNVSKQIVAAFVTLNDKLDSSVNIINDKASDNYSAFEAKRAALLAQKGDLREFNQWNDKVLQVKKETAAMVNFLLGESNEMIKEAEGEDWVAEKDEEGNIVALKPLIDIQSMDNYDIPTNMFVGGNPTSPVERGLAIRDKMHKYRNMVCGLMGTYTFGDNSYQFNAPDNPEGLSDALKTANPDDTAAISQFYRSLTIPEKLHAHGEEKDMPWASVTFDHAPIVAAAAMFTSLKLDVKNAEAMAGEFMLAKVKAPIFVFNKIEPTAFASSSYINQGESLDLNVMVAAVDTTAIHKIRWGMDEDTLPERWTETQGKIALEGTEPGPHRVKGTIGVQERGSISWKPWSFAYNVGQPMGVIAQPKMRILYRDYDNILEGTASGFASDKVRLSSSDVSLSKKGNQWVARAGSGVRSAKISVIGTKDDGSSVNLGSFEYKVKPLPKPQMYFGSISNGANPTLANAKAQKNSKVSVRYDESVTLTDVKFRLVSGTVKADGLNRKGKINANGFLDEDAKKVIDQSRGKQVTMIMKYKNPSGNTYKTALVFEVR